MKSNTIASEKTPVFYVKLKKSAIDAWYLPDLKMKPLAKRKIPKELVKREFKIDSIAFFKKHVWYHFETMTTDQSKGWIHYKLFRRNYCRLDVVPIKREQECFLDEDLAAIRMVFQYYGAPVSYHQLINQINHPIDLHFKPNDLFEIFVNETGSFEDLTKKTFRRITHQLLRCHPVIMWISLLNGDQCPIVLIGFNHRTFFYNDPRNGNFNLISRVHLNRMWKKAGSFAISY
ncbi:hypothetical protein WR164_10730 [Philodulcilactobacillus myokoensis]|uniref:Peptidase C39-like domain-containing protein n=1 Tax=Philodulcilactobacillus myokoensis TaxID=2929573 RepID=A0A9W6ETL0_9LACO|nr:hypothetical protein [Philodulcilactobacillus myokoensis]GLB47094.1 hypothetical protein WR164_10730 [Philodulcilactobacillus myokoensis]